MSRLPRARSRIGASVEKSRSLSSVHSSWYSTLASSHSSTRSGETSGSPGSRSHPANTAARR